MHAEKPIRVAGAGRPSRVLLESADGRVHGLALDLVKPIMLPSGARCSRIVFRLPTLEDFAQSDRGDDTPATMAAMFQRLTGHPGDVLGRLGMRDWDGAVDTMSLLLDAFNDAQMRAALEILPPGHC